MPLTKIVDTFRVDQDGVGGGPFDAHVHVQALTDGGFVYAWRERDMDGNGQRERIYVRKFDANGNPVGNQFEIPGAMHETPHPPNAYGDLWRPSIAALADGGFAVEYNDLNYGTDWTNGTHGPFWTWAAIFDASGALLDQETPLGVPDADVPAQRGTIWLGSAVASDGEGGYHHGFIQTRHPTEGSGTRIVLNGLVVKGANGPTDGYDIASGSLDIADHASGAIAIYQRQNPSAPYPSDIWAITSTGFEFRVNEVTDGDQSFGSEGEYLVQLSDGNYVAVWQDTNITTDEATDPGGGVHARIFRGDGTFVTGDIVLSATPASEEYAPAVAAMSGGRWIACWEDDAGNVAQVFSATGERLGDQIALGTGAAQDSLTITVLEDDRIVFAFNDGGSTTSSQIWRFPDIFGTAASETVNGGAGDDVLHGLGGNDKLNGKGGADEMRGGAGDDVFIVDQPGDFAVELADEGFDEVVATVNHTLGDNVEALTLKGAANQGTGNGGANEIAGAGQNDTLLGLGGDDVLIGNGGGDSLDGGDGIDAAAYAGKVRADLQNPGVNTNQASGDVYVGIENLIGSKADDILRGDAAGNLLDGGKGSDQLVGRDGDDRLIGGVGDDLMEGGNGADTLEGGVGIDGLTGGAGADRFLLEIPLAAHADVIFDFETGIDQIALVDSAFGLPLGALAPEAFHAGAAAHDADDRIIYHAASGRLFYDSDGTGAAGKVQIAELADGTIAVVGDFVVVGDPAAAPLSAAAPGSTEAPAFEIDRGASTPNAGAIATAPARHWMAELSAPGAGDWLA
ncbi:MAG: calcium-binding protein [Sphingomonadaceae bacterium]|nr:calcium-binding protein [Sphingomonadaceae bacterium]